MRPRARGVGAPVPSAKNKTGKTSGPGTARYGQITLFWEWEARGTRLYPYGSKVPAYLTFKVGKVPRIESEEEVARAVEGYLLRWETEAAPAALGLRASPHLPSPSPDPSAGNRYVLGAAIRVGCAFLPSCGLSPSRSTLPPQSFPLLTNTKPNSNTNILPPTCRRDCRFSLWNVQLPLEIPYVAERVQSYLGARFSISFAHSCFPASGQGARRHDRGSIPIHLAPLIFSFLNYLSSFSSPSSLFHSLGSIARPDDQIHRLPLLILLVNRLR